MFFMASFWRKSAFTEYGCICNFWHLEYKKKLGVETQEESEGELKKKKLSWLQRRRLLSVLAVCITDGF